MKRSFASRVLAACLLVVVRTYRTLVSPLLGARCRFQPTCSAYAEESLKRYGGVKGGWLAVKRIARCHPWGGSGYDPLPERVEQERCERP